MISKLRSEHRDEKAPRCGGAVQEIVGGDGGKLTLEEEAQPLGEDGVQEHAPWHIHAVVDQEGVGAAGHRFLEEAQADG